MDFEDFYEQKTGTAPPEQWREIAAKRGLDPDDEEGREDLASLLYRMSTPIDFVADQEDR